MPKHLRYDTGDLKEPIRLDNGYIRADSRITRVGVFQYMTGGGKIRRELRLPEEVFKADALESFELAPLTNEHPAEQLNSKNTRKFSVGIVSGARQDGEFVRANVTIMDDGAISDAEGGKRELSCGYRCDLEMTPGVTNGVAGVPDGIRYDAIQRNIRGNHVALVTRGRAGRDAALRLDDEDAILVTDADEAPQNLNPQESTKMAKVTIDGVDFEVSEQAAQAIGKVVARADSASEQIDAAKKAIEQEKARADKAEEDRDNVRKDLESVKSDESIREAVAARLDLGRAAVKVLGQEKADEMEVAKMDAADIKRAVVLAVSPSAESKLEGCSGEYLEARFDHALEAHKPEEKTDENDAPKPRWAKADVSEDQDNRFDVDAARARMIKENQERGRRSLGKAAS